MLGLETRYGGSRQRSVTEAYRHNPYIGAMQYHSRGLRHHKSNKLLPTKEKTNAYVGTFRHAPETQGLKDILWEDDHWRTPIVSQLQLARQSLLSKQHLELTALKLLPVGLFRAPEDCIERPMCVICLDEFEDGDELRHLNCDHCFHRACIDMWLLGTLSEDEINTTSCPICKQCAHPNSTTTITGTGHTAATRNRANDGAGDDDEQDNDDDDDGGGNIPAAVFQMVGEALHASDLDRAHPLRYPLLASSASIITTTSSSSQQEQVNRPAASSNLFAPLMARLLPMQEVWQQ